MNDKRNTLFVTSDNSIFLSDRTLIEVVQCILDLNTTGYVNVDYQDIKSVFDDTNIAVITYAIGKGLNRMTDVINQIYASPLWEEYLLKYAQKIMIKLLSSSDSNHPINAHEISEVVKFTSKFPKSVEIKWGISDCPNIGENVKMILLASYNKKD